MAGVTVFFDLETTDSHFLGQILNYAFIAVDSSWNPIGECCGLIRISRLQLPAPGAILANRTDVLAHQRSAEDDEQVAMRRIFDFLEGVSKKHRGFKLIGFNSTKFDIPYLRTSAIRNGVNPYVSNMTYGDLLHVARFLMMGHSEFLPLTKAPEGSGKVRVCTLEHLSTELGLLKEAQRHESRDDVLLTIEVAKRLADRFRCDVRTFVPYSGLAFHKDSFRGSIFQHSFPLYESVALGHSFVSLLDFDHKNSLWVDLDRYAAGEGRDSILWTNTERLFQVEPISEPDEESVEIAREAASELKGITTKTFFARSTCDIEADIYRLDADGRIALEDAVWRSNGSRVKDSSSKDLKVLFARYKLRSIPDVFEGDGRLATSLGAYAKHRYGGDAIVSKFSVDPSDEEAVSNQRHPSLGSYLNLILSVLPRGGEDARLLSALLRFYGDSDIAKVCGRELGLEVTPTPDRSPSGEPVAAAD